MEAERCDLLVIGAGLAGLAVAEAALKNGPLKAMVIDHRGVGSNATTPLSFLDTLEEFGLMEAVQARYNRFTFQSPYGSRSSHLFTGAPLVALNYRRACQILFEKANTSNGLELIAERAIQLEREPGGWRLKTSGGRWISARLLIDASGRAFTTAHNLGLPIPRTGSHSLGIRLKGCFPADPNEVFFMAPSQAYGGGGGWFYPLDGGEASFGVAVLRPGGQPFARGTLRDLLRKARAELQPFADWMASAQVETIEWGVIPVHPLRRFVYDRLMLVGDSAGQATNWACMGSAMALISGRLAGEVAANALCRGEPSARCLYSYEQLWRERYGRIYFQAEQMTPFIYGQNDEQWARNLAFMQNLTPEQMIARLRTNWPQLPRWKLAFIVWYDRLGRWRRCLEKILRTGISRRLQRGKE